jgi:predicted ester cyclase
MGRIRATPMRAPAGLNASELVTSHWRITMPEENKRIVRRWIEDLWNEKGDECLCVADEVISPDYKVHDPGSPWREGGVEGEKQTFKKYRDIFPDLKYTIEDMIEEGDRVAFRHTVVCSHLGEGLGDPPIPPTGKKVEVSGISIVRIVGGKIVEHWIHWDNLGLLQQLGFGVSKNDD